MDNEILINALSAIANTGGSKIELSTKACKLLAKRALEHYAAQQSVQADGFWACAECDYQNVNALDICTHCFNRRR